MRNMRHELYGESVFTSFRNFESKVFGFQLHITRLYDAVCKFYGIDHLSEKEFFNYFFCEKELNKLFKENPNHYFRITIFSTSEASLDKVKFGVCDLDIDVSVRELGSIRQAVKLTAIESPFSEAYVPIKSGSYFQNIYFKKLAIKKGFDDVLFCMNEKVIEASTSNIIFSKGNSFFTPAGNFFLRGITLELFKDYCENQNTEFSEINILKKDLADFDSAFLLNSVQMITSIEKIDSDNFNLEVFNKLKENFINHCKDKK